MAKPLPSVSSWAQVHVEPDEVVDGDYIGGDYIDGEVIEDDLVGTAPAVAAGSSPSAVMRVAIAQIAIGCVLIGFGTVAFLFADRLGAWLLPLGVVFCGVGIRGSRRATDAFVKRSSLL